MSIHSGKAAAPLRRNPAAAVAASAGRAVWLAGPFAFHSFNRDGGNILRGSFVSRSAAGLLCLCFALICVGQEEGAYDSLGKALREPAKVRRLTLGPVDPEAKHLPPGLGKLVNLEALEMACM